MDPRIGTLVKDGKTVYYAFVNGYDQPHTEGTLEEIEIALGIHEASSFGELVRGKALHEVTSNTPARPKYKKYDVKVTPRIKTYGESRLEEYTTQVIAENHSDAIKRARAEHAANGEGGRYGIPCIFTAKRSKED